MAFLGGGVLSRARPVTPTRCVQRFGPAVECAARSAMAGPNRGRTVLPPLHDEGNAFVIGGGNLAAPASAQQFAWRKDRASNAKSATCSPDTRAPARG